MSIRFYADLESIKFNNDIISVACTICDLNNLYE